MLKRYAFLLLLASLPLSGMKKDDVKLNTNHDYERRMSRMVDNLLSFDEREQSLISREDSNEILLRLNTDIHNLVKENDQDLQANLKEITEHITNYDTANKISSSPGSLESISEMGKFEKKIYDLIKSFKSINDVNTIKDVLKYCNLWVNGDKTNTQRIEEWISDLHEQILERLAFKFGSQEKFKEMALEFGTPGALTWLSRQKAFCQSLPPARLDDLLSQARVAMTDCDAPKTVALASILNNTSYADTTRNALCKFVHTGIEFIHDNRNPEIVAPKILSRIAILGNLGYNLRDKETWGPKLMQAALKANFPSFVAELELRGAINPTKPALPYFKTKYNAPTKETVYLDKIYAKKDDEEVPEFHWTNEDADAKLKKSKFAKLLNH